MKQIRANNRNDLQSNFRQDTVYLMYTSAEGNRGKGLKFVKWTPKRFVIICYLAIDGHDTLATNYAPDWLKHDYYGIPQYEIFKLDEDEFLKHTVMEVI